MDKTIGGLSMFTLWLGAAVSLAEIMTGSLLAPLGLGKGLLVILVGHLIGTLILAAVGLIGFRERKTAIESAKHSFGEYGGKIIALLNCIQLIGWTAIMLLHSTRSLQVVTEKLLGFNNFTVLTILAGSLVLLWTLSNHNGKHLVNSAAVLLLFGLCILMVVLIFRGQPTAPLSGGLSVAVGLELSIVMPLSWIPLIADYTRWASSKRVSFWGCFGGYFLGSSFMYFIGLSCALYTGSADPIEMLSRLNLGVAAILVILLSTTTTTFLNVYSTVMSASGLTHRFEQRTLIIFFAALGTVLALYFPMDRYETFLYMIGSVFAPVFTVVLLDYYVYRNDFSGTYVNKAGLLAAVLGIWSYYQLAELNLILGTSVPAMLVTAAIYVALTTAVRVFRGSMDSLGQNQ